MNLNQPSESDESERKGPVGNNRFDQDDGGEADMPDGDESGGGFFWLTTWLIEHMHP